MISVLISFMISYCNILCNGLSRYNLYKEVIFMKNEPIKIKKRGEDGNRVITVRIKEDTLAEIDRIAAESNYSRNELINIILSHGIENIEIV